jgi:hypothetical protein
MQPITPISHFDILGDELHINVTHSRWICQPHLSSNIRGRLPSQAQQTSHPSPGIEPRFAPWSSRRDSNPWSFLLGRQMQWASYATTAWRRTGYLYLRGLLQTFVPSVGLEPTALRLEGEHSLGFRSTELRGHYHSPFDISFALNIKNFHRKKIPSNFCLFFERERPRFSFRVVPYLPKGIFLFFTSIKTVPLIFFPCMVIGEKQWGQQKTFEARDGSEPPMHW